MVPGQVRRPAASIHIDNAYGTMGCNQSSSGLETATDTLPLSGYSNTQDIPIPSGFTLLPARPARDTPDLRHFNLCTLIPAGVSPDTQTGFVFLRANILK